ncbi:MAG: putative amidohydrolase YtcJ [Limisphaerales bacterium]|jgi:predicted amidohydrolase YtcJ
MNVESKMQIDKIFTNGNFIIPHSGSFSNFYGCLAVQNGKIEAIGSEEELSLAYSTDNYIDFKNAYCYPGFRDPHCHLLYLGQQSFLANLVGLKSPEALVNKLIDFAESNDSESNSEWVIGRGWNQMLWEDGNSTQYYNEVRDRIDAAFPNRPVYLTRIDGHAALVNSQALKRAGISGPKNIDGGAIDCANGIPTGLLIDAAMQFCTNIIPAQTDIDLAKAFLKAQELCIKQGLTAVTDCGLPKSSWDILIELQREKKMFIPVNGMLTPEPETEAWFRKNGPFRTNLLKLSCFKYFADGALGSRGARMLSDYSDDPANMGIWMHDPAYLYAQAQKNKSDGFQMSVHAIGDAAARLVLDINAKVKPAAVALWRMEHAQILSASDITRFASTGTVPSIQTCHAISDRNMAFSRLGKRLGLNRKKGEAGAYLAKSLLDEFGWLVNGSDFPIETERPLRNFYTAVARKELSDDQSVTPFIEEEKLSRTEALKAMTIWDAKLAFEADKRGSIQLGKQADFTILDKDILNCSESQIPYTKVLKTIIAGEIVYKQSES